MRLLNDPINSIWYSVFSYLHAVFCRWAQRTMRLSINSIRYSEFPILYSMLELKGEDELSKSWQHCENSFFCHRALEVRTHSGGSPRRCWFVKRSFKPLLALPRPFVSLWLQQLFCQRNVVWNLFWHKHLHPSVIIHMLSKHSFTAISVMTQSQMLGKFEYTRGPIFKVVLEC